MGSISGLNASSIIDYEKVVITETMRLSYMICRFSTVLRIRRTANVSVVDTPSILSSITLHPHLVQRF